jgi:hypothetical protein
MHISFCRIIEVCVQGYVLGWGVVDLFITMMWEVVDYFLSGVCVKLLSLDVGW